MARGKQAAKPKAAAKATKEVKKNEVEGMVEHIITQEDLDLNPGMEKDVKVGDVVFVPKEVEGMSVGVVEKIADAEGADAPEGGNGVPPEEVADKVSEKFTEAVKVPKASKEKIQAIEEGISAKDAKINQINAIFDDLETRLCHGSAEQMNEQQNELLSAKLKIKRLI